MNNGNRNRICVSIDKLSRCQRCGKIIEKGLRYCWECAIEIEIREREQQMEM